MALCSLIGWSVRIGQGASANHFARTEEFSGYSERCGTGTYKWIVIIAKDVAEDPIVQSGEYLDKRFIVERKN